MGVGTALGSSVGEPVGVSVGGFDTRSTSSEFESTLVEFTFLLTAATKELLLSDDVIVAAHSSTEDVEESEVVDVTRKLSCQNTSPVSNLRRENEYVNTQPRIWLSCTPSCVATVCFSFADC